MGSRVYTERIQSSRETVDCGALARRRRRPRGWSSFMNRSVFRIRMSLALTVILCAVSTAAYAQGSTSQALSGTVVDVSGAVIPGADVAAKHNATGVVSNAVTNSEGLFSIPSLPIGTYTVSVTLQGFKTGIIQNVVLTSGAGASIKVALEVGGVS